MKTNRVFSIVAIIALCLASAPDQAQAQQPSTRSNTANGSARSGDDAELSNLVAQARPRRRAFALMAESSYAKVSGPIFSITPAAAGPNLSVAGSGTVGRLTKWIGFNSSNSFIGDSSIYEDKFGKVGIGTDTPTSLLTVAGMIEAMGGFKFPDGSVQTTAGISSVTRDASLRGMGTLASPLGIALGGVNTEHLANGAVTTPKIANGALGTAQLADASVTAPKIASGQVVKSLNSLRDDVTLAAGSNITITPSGNTLTLAATGVLTSVAHDSTLKGDGTSASPLGVRVPLNLFSDIPISVIDGTNTSTSRFAIGVTGRTPSTGLGIGVLGVGGNDFDPASGTAGIGVKGLGTHGLVGEAIEGGRAIVGQPAPGAVNFTAGLFRGLVQVEGDLRVLDDLKVIGDKDFVEPHPTDPNLMIAYVALEGPEAGTYFRGSGRIVNGVATVEVPEDFRMVTDEKGITVQVTPMGEPAMIWCVRKSLDQIELRGSADVEFDFLVNGVRRMSKDRKAIVENTVFVPLTPNDDSLTRIRKPEAIRRLKATGILNEDGTVNMETVEKLDAYKRTHKRQ